ncbi:MAG: hypothetical protein IPG79_16625 [Saprospiraceae bacterium]|nr:hypothetical protein [Saprospiraceae bacterium]
MFITSCTNDINDSSTEFKQASEYNADVPYEWFELMIEIDRYSPNYRPPAASRMMGYIDLLGMRQSFRGCLIINH